MDKVVNEKIIIIISFVLMCVSVFFLRWYMNSNLVAIVSALSSAMLFVLLKKYKSVDKVRLLSIIAFLLYVVINILFTSEHTYLIIELLKLALSFSIVYFFTIFYNSKDIYKITKKPIFYSFNLYYLVNSFIIWMQIKKPGFMIRNFSVNKFYPDQIDGFFGTNGTHRLCLFYLLILYMNLSFFKSKSKIERIVAKTMSIIILFSSVYLSTFNDNRMYYFLLIIFFAPIIYKMVKRKKDGIKHHALAGILTILLIVSLLGLIYKFNTNFKNFVNVNIYNQYILKTKNRIKNSISGGDGKKEERIELTVYALKEGNGFFLGKGIGAVKSYWDPKVPKHFGLCETTIKIYNGGIIYLLLLIWLFSIYLFNYYPKKQKIALIFIVVTMIIFCFYTRIFSDLDEMFLVSLIYFFIEKYMNDEGKKYGSRKQ